MYSDLINHFSCIETIIHRLFGGDDWCPHVAQFIHIVIVQGIFPHDPALESVFYYSKYENQLYP